MTSKASDVPEGATAVVGADGKRRFNQSPNYIKMRYLPMNVLEAAKRRIAWQLDRYDEVWVSFSGGKDSLVVLKLTEMVMDERGDKRPVLVKFMDEELVCNEVINFVAKEAANPRYDFHWYCLQMYVGFYVMGVHKPFVCWNPERKWHRQPPEKAIMSLPGGIDTRGLNENQIGDYMYPDPTKKVAVQLGLRSQESMKRYMAVCHGGKEVGWPSYISTGAVAKHMHVNKPIYDWTEIDVFKFFQDYGIQYCPYYDLMGWARAPLRVGSALHERSTPQLFKMKEMDPLFYQQIIDLYPEVETHYRYYREMDTGSKIFDFPPTFDGVRQYIEKYIDPSHQEEALTWVGMLETKRRNNLLRAPNMPLGGVSVLQIFREVAAGRFVKATGLGITVEQRDIDFENGIRPDF